jgi:hypothetical protein
MEKQFDNTNTFTLGKADKGDNPKRPDYKGKVNIDGKWYYLDGWIRTAGDGSKFISGTTKPAEKPAEKPAAKQQKIVESDDDIPF